MTYLDYRKKIEFGIAQYVEIAVYAKQIGIEWFSSVWDTDSLNLMVQLFPSFYKNTISLSD